MAECSVQVGRDAVLLVLLDAEDFRDADEQVSVRDAAQDQVFG